MLLPRLFGGQTITGEAVMIDGDSLRLDGRELRLEGIDAPELDQVCEREGRSYQCGRLAKRIAHTKLSAGQLACQVNGADRYGRGLALCAVAGDDLNASLVREGMAVSEGRYRREEDEARRAGRGLWAVRSSVRPTGVAAIRARRIAEIRYVTLRTSGPAWLAYGRCCSSPHLGAASAAPFFWLASRRMS